MLQFGCLFANHIRTGFYREYALNIRIISFSWAMAGVLCQLMVESNLRTEKVVGNPIAIGFLLST